MGIQFSRKCHLNSQAGRVLHFEDQGSLLLGDGGVRALLVFRSDLGLPCF